MKEKVKQKKRRKRRGRERERERERERSPKRNGDYKTKIAMPVLRFGHNDWFLKKENLARVRERERMSFEQL